MRAFMDTSVLAKKYIEESGVEMFDQLWSKVTGVVVAPSYMIEIYSIVERRLREKTISAQDQKWIKSEIAVDILDFETVLWDQQLISTALELVNTYPLKALDTIQLASALYAKPDIFVTSDKGLFKYARLEMKNAVLVE